MLAEARRLGEPACLRARKATTVSLSVSCVSLWVCPCRRRGHDSTPPAPLTGGQLTTFNRSTALPSPATRIVSPPAQRRCSPSLCARAADPGAGGKRKGEMQGQRALSPHLPGSLVLAKAYIFIIGWCCQVGDGVGGLSTEHTETTERREGSFNRRLRRELSTEGDETTERRKENSATPVRHTVR